MIVDNVDLKLGLLGTSSSMVTLTFYFSFMYIEVVLGRRQWPITYFKGAKDDFVVHDVNNPIDSL